MQNKSQDLSERLLKFSVEIIKLYSRISKTMPGRYIGGQLIRSASSAGANYEEACAAESRSDFIHKMQIVLKELRESLYWLKLLVATELIKAEEITWHLTECLELIKIVASSIITARKHMK